MKSNGDRVFVLHSRNCCRDIYKTLFSSISMNYENLFILSLDIFLCSDWRLIRGTMLSFSLKRNLFKLFTLQLVCENKSNDIEK